MAANELNMQQGESSIGISPTIQSSKLQLNVCKSYEKVPTVRKVFQRVLGKKKRLDSIKTKLEMM